MIRSSMQLKKKRERETELYVFYKNARHKKSCSKELSRESRFDSLIDSWFPPRDIFNQGNENLREVLGRCIGTSLGFSTSGTKVARDSQGWARAGGDTYLTQDQQNPVRRGRGMVGRARGRLEGWILRTGGDLIYMLIDDGGRCRRVHSLSCYSFTPS